MRSSLAGCNSNGGTRQVQKFCEEFDAGGVGFAVRGRGGKREFQSVACYAGDGVLLCPRVDFDREGRAGVRVLNWNHMVGSYWCALHKDVRTRSRTIPIPTPM